MTGEIKIITPEILKEWKTCSDGYKRFCELLPNGGTLKECINALVTDKHDEWGYWLFRQCQNKDDFKNQTLEGYGNSGNWNSGYGNSGNWNSGYWNSGNWNSGDWNSGNRNSGDWNSGNWNSGYGNSGFFNTQTPDEILVFNKLCKIEKWESANKPNFIFFDLNYWVSENRMTDQEKIDNPQFYITGGYLKEVDYKDAWRQEWDKATKEDKELLFKLPNFDAQVFFEISGINIEEEN